MANEHVDEVVSRRMSRVRGKDTAPEMVVRRALHGMGYRYRLHDKKLPGRPDVVFHGRKKAIFVNGCFWHFHENCPGCRLPKSRREFWMPKLEENRRRDERALTAMKEAGWDTLVVWECEMRDVDALKKRLRAFLEEEQGTVE